MDFKAPQELWNPLSKAVPGKFHGSGGHSKCNCLQDRANFHRSQAWQIVRIFRQCCSLPVVNIVHVDALAPLGAMTFEGPVIKFTSCIGNLTFRIPIHIYIFTGPDLGNYCVCADVPASCQTRCFHNFSGTVRFQYILAYLMMSLWIMVLRPEYYWRAGVPYHGCWWPGDFMLPGHQHLWYWL